MTKLLTDLLYAAVSDGFASARRPFVLGLCGAQGSGKSTAAAALAARFANDNLRAAVLSLDDLYLPQAERQALAAATYPLLVTRGVPGTHDVKLGERLLTALGRATDIAIPRFDKGSDTRAPAADWPVVAAPVDVVIFEGWCVGVVPQSAAELAQPVNALEREEDPDGTWRQWVNRQCAAYDRLFARIDFLALLAAPSFSIVATWREEQEAELRASLTESGQGDAMSAPEVMRFVQHYQRLTEHILREMPHRADLVVRLASDRRISGVERAAPSKRVAA